MLNINDIFYSIQGESSFAGYPCRFIRLAGCNIKCSYCDSKEALNSAYSMNMDIEGILNALNNAGGKNVKLIEVTGGEPLIQENVYRLFEELLKLNYLVLLETNGTINLRKVPEKVIKIVDIKCPSSGFSNRFDYENLNYINETDEIKFVIGTDNDYDFAVDFLNKEKLKTKRIIFSAVSAVMPLKKLALKILENELNVRLGIQLHKILMLK